ncbi:hypothetical protein C0989_009940, partial [Termitomyces sp. Mn162]
MLGLSIQIRILRSVQDVERERREDQRVLVNILRGENGGVGLGLTGIDTQAPGMGVSESAITVRPEHATPTKELAMPRISQGTPTISDPSPADNTQVLPALKTVQASQDAQDQEKDNEDTRALMRAALRAGSDAEMLRVLQIGREEMPEAIKTLQRALERVGGVGLEVGKEEGKKKWGMGKCVSVSTAKTSTGTEASSDTLDREFIESGIDALRRMSRGAGVATSSLPPWTITRYEVDREQKIGVGFFSDVYRGTWRGRTVAIKVLAPTTPRELFVREVQVWRGLRHPSVLQLYGASSACGERPWFFVCAYMRRGSLVEFLKRVERGVEGGMEGARVVFPIWEEGQMAVGGHPRKSHEEGDLFRFMLEIAQGMEYLHANGVLHGDLKAANVLVDDD